MDASKNAASVENEENSRIGTSALTAERRWTVTVMGDAIIFMGGIAVGSLITIFICMIAVISDDIRRSEDIRREKDKC